MICSRHCSWMESRCLLGRVRAHFPRHQFLWNLVERFNDIFPNNSLESMRKAWESGAAQTMHQAPEPKQDCKVVYFWHRLADRVHLLHCSCAPRGHIRIHSFVFSDRSGSTKPSLVGRAIFMAHRWYQVQNAKHTRKACPRGVPANHPLRSDLPAQPP